MTAELYIKRTDLLGEGMLCLGDENKLYWVDILGKRLMCSNTSGENITEYSFDTEIGAVLPAPDKEVVIVLRNSAALFAPETGEARVIWNAGAHEPSSNRFNDASIDHLGNLWVCSMDFDAIANTGALYRISPIGEAQMILSGYPCLNGPVFSPDGKTVYLADTMGGEIIAFEFDHENSQVSNQRIFKKFSPFEGLPDGMTVDGAGQIWACHITAGRICRYDSSGQKTATVTLPVPIVTSCCFGADDLSILYATTARILLDEIDLAAYPDSGSVFRIETSVRGQPPNVFGVSNRSVS